MTRFLLSCLLFTGMMLNAQINLGTGSTDVGVAPVSTYYGYSYVQQIFTRQEMNANAAGNITGLRFYMDPALSVSSSSQWTVYLGQTSKTSFASNTDWIPLNQLTQVFSGTVTNANGVIQVNFTTPFPYNNISNLVVAAKENTPGYNINNDDEAIYVYSGAANSLLYYRNDNVNPNPASPPAGNRENYKSVITILGLAPNPVPACPIVTYPAVNSTFVPLSPVITWNTSSGATGYRVSIGTSPGGTDIANQVAVSANTYTPAAPLSSNTTYYLRVTAVSAAGESSGCSNIVFTTAPGAPANDECASAQTLTVNPDLNCGTITSGYTLGATDSGTNPVPCYGTADDDVWFKFVATSATHKISLNNIQSVGDVEDDDTYFQVFSGSCGALTSVFCSDPATGTLTGLTPGQTYYVRVYSYEDTGSNQSFSICVGTYPPPPVNDNCSGALIASSFPYTFVQNDGAGATDGNGTVTACTDGMNDGTWFSFTGDGDTYTLSVNMPSGSDFDPQIGVYSGTCSALTCVGTVNNGWLGETETLGVATVPGTTYYVNVGHSSGWSDEPEDAFTISITKGTLSASEARTAKEKIRVYPNPFADVLHISEAAEVKSVSVSDISGRLLKTIDRPDSSIHLEDLKPGSYLVVLYMKNGSQQVIKTIKK